MKICELRGSENLPQKVVDNKTGIFTHASKVKNETIDQYNSLSIDGDVEALANRFKPVAGDEIYLSLLVLANNLNTNNKEEGQARVALAEAIIAILDKFLVIKSGRTLINSIPKKI